MKFSINFPEAGLGIKLNCNTETTLDASQVQKLWSCQMLMLDDPAANPQEAEFVKLWMEGGFLPPAMKQGLPTRQATIASHTIERDFQATLRQLRSGLSTSSARATVYKHLFVAALRSELRLDKLSAMAAWAREHLELEPTTATLISDLISAELPDFPHKPILLSRTERETILAIAILVLNADEQKHILELTALRSVMLCLDITTANNSQMSALARQGPLKLIETLPVQALPTALLNILRIVIADHAVHERERNVVVAIKSRIEPRHIQTIRKMTTLETGIAFDL